MAEVRVEKNGVEVGGFTVETTENGIKGDMWITSEWLERNLPSMRTWKKFCERKDCDYIATILHLFDEYFYSEGEDRETFTYEAYDSNGEYVVDAKFPTLPYEEDIEYVLELHIAEDVSEAEFERLEKETKIFLEKFVLCFAPIVKAIRKYLKSLKSKNDNIDTVDTVEV